MDLDLITERNKRNIRQALEDYRTHTDWTDVLDAVSDDFIDRLARDNALSKMALREMFSKSPVWDEELDALVINGTRTHDPDPDLISLLAWQIIYPPQFPDKSSAIYNAIQYFTHVDEEYELGIAAIKSLAPKAYAPGKKRSRIFKALCNALGVTDNTAGSEFQRLYAQFADELSSRRIGFKLFVSVNPGHFITMSNPKSDCRGSTLTSCHSFNSTEYTYNNGCTGYARDKVTFIVFTAADPNNPETLNNRKTTRQIFAYQPGNGLLMQSRLYNTSGGTRGAQAESVVYRDLVQREISFCEGAPNLWKTYPYLGDHEGDVDTGYGFGGYADWTYRDFEGKVSIRADHEDDYEPLTVGTYGLCCHCGCETSDGVMCDDCKDGHDNQERCEECGSYFDEDELYCVHDSHGNEIYVCEDCRDSYYTYCEECGEWYPNDDCTQVASGQYVCNDCLEENYEQCECCDEWFPRGDLNSVITASGDEACICDGCLERDGGYEECYRCGRMIHVDQSVEVYDADGEVHYVCANCADHFEECDECGRRVPEGTVVDGLCRECREEKAEAESHGDENEEVVA